MMNTRMRQGHWLVKSQMVVACAVVNLALVFYLPPTIARNGQKALKIVAFGDSLTAGYGIKRSQSFPLQLQRRLNAKGHNVKVLNAGVSGDTTGTALARYSWAIPIDTDAVILELGANDALRGKSPKRARANLDKIIAKLRKQKIDVLIAGMIAPRSFGKDYSQKFDPIFSELAQKYDQLHYPFFLDGVALDPKLNLPDGLHPTEEGVAVIVDRILPFVEKLILRARARISNKPKS